MFSTKENIFWQNDINFFMFIWLKSFPNKFSFLKIMENDLPPKIIRKLFSKKSFIQLTSQLPTLNQIPIIDSWYLFEIRITILNSGPNLRIWLETLLSKSESTWGWFSIWMSKILVKHSRSNFGLGWVVIWVRC